MSFAMFSSLRYTDSIEAVWNKACNQEDETLVRIANFQQVKKRIKNEWNSFSTPWKDVIRENLLNVIIANLDKKEIMDEVEQITNAFSNEDFVKNNITILNQAIEKLKDPNNIRNIKGVIKLIETLLKLPEHRLYMRMQAFPAAVPKVFNELMVLIDNLLFNYTEEAAETINNIFEIFNNGVKIELHECLPIESYDDVFNLLKKVFAKELPLEMISTSEDPLNDKRANSAFWRNKENCQIYISELIQKKLYFYKVDKSDHISLTFLSKYALAFLEISLLFLLKSKTEYVPSKIQAFCIDYLHKSLQFSRQGGVDLLSPWERKNTDISRTYDPIPDFKQLVLSQLEFVILEVLIPSLVMNTEDSYLLQSSPETFIQKECSSFENSSSPRTLAKEILLNLLQSFDNNDYLLKFLQYALKMLEIDGGDVRIKEAIFYAIGSLKNIIINSQIENDMEELVTKYILPEINNGNNLLRYRATWLIGVYGDSIYSKPYNIEKIVSCLFNLLNDTQISVKFVASISLANFIRIREGQEIVRPFIEKVVEIYIGLIGKINQIQLIEAFIEILLVFKQEISPFNFRLTEYLVQMFFNVHPDEKEIAMEEEKEEEKDYENENEKDYENENEKEENEDNFQFVPVAIGYLKLINELTKDQISNENLDSFEKTIVELIDFCLSDEGINYVEFGLKILLNLLSKSATISNLMWDFYPRINYISGGVTEPEPQKPIEELTGEFSDNAFAMQMKIMSLKLEAERKAKLCIGFADEHVDLIVPILQNYIQKGREIVFEKKDSIFEITYIDLLFRTINKLKLKGNVDSFILHTLYFTLLENYPNQIDELMLKILGESVEELLVSKEYELQASLAEIIIYCFWYNSDLTIQFLQDKQLLERYFNFLFKITSRFTKSDQCKRLMLGLASVFRGKASQFPEIMTKFLPQILKETINISSRILKSRNEDDQGFEEEFELPQGFNNTAMYILYGNFEEDEYDGGEFYVRPQGNYFSPLENKCEILFLKESLEYLQKSSIDIYNQLILTIAEDEKLLLQNNFEIASKQQNEVEHQQFEALPEQAEKVHI